MPIRDVEEFFPATGRRAARALEPRRQRHRRHRLVRVRRGRRVGAGPVVLLIGDVALAHDIGGLLAARRLGLALTIVLLNNDGGGIFHFLPVAGETDAFEEHVATPHGLDFARAAALYGCGHDRPDTLATCARASRRRSPPTPPRSSRFGPTARGTCALHRRVRRGGGRGR